MAPTGSHIANGNCLPLPFIFGKKLKSHGAISLSQLLLFRAFYKIKDKISHFCLIKTICKSNVILLMPLHMILKGIEALLVTSTVNSQELSPSPELLFAKLSRIRSHALT